MAKPILLVRIDMRSFTHDQCNALTQAMKSLGIDKEYHLLTTSVGAPEDSFSLEVFNSDNADTVRIEELVKSLL